MLVILGDTYVLAANHNLFDSFIFYAWNLVHFVISIFFGELALLHHKSPQDLLNFWNFSYANGKEILSKMVEKSF